MIWGASGLLRWAPFLSRNGSCTSRFGCGQRNPMLGKGNGLINMCRQINIIGKYV
jgi:hypothetical protein